MGSVMTNTSTQCHMVALPYPGRGHINPMMNICKVLVSREDDIIINFVLTEEWFSFIGSDPKPENIHFITIPNVVPSELVRAANMDEFYEAVLTKMAAPVEQVLDRFDKPPTVIMADTNLSWAVGVGNRRNIPVASFWPMSATVFSMFHHFNLFKQNGHFPMDLLGRGNERVDYIPGVSPFRLMDVPSFINGTHPYMMCRILQVISRVPKSQCLIFRSINELESEAIDALKQEFSIPIYTLGPAIPHFKLDHNASTNDYITWLDCQPPKSVLYISMGSFLSFSSAQMDEIADALHDSGVKYLWVARHEASRLKEVMCSDRGLVVPWCDQMRVLCHSSVGGFWTHCGLSSVFEGIIAGVPFLTFPIVADQWPNSKSIVEDWKIGWRVKKEYGVENVVTKEEMRELVKKFMNLENNEGRAMRKKVKEVQEKFLLGISKEGSVEVNINSFIRDFCFG